MAGVNYYFLCFLALGSTIERRRERYRKLIEQGIPNGDLDFIRGALQRNQLTGTEAFIVRVEQLVGKRTPQRAGATA